MNDQEEKYGIVFFFVGLIFVAGLAYFLAIHLSSRREVYNAPAPAMPIPTISHSASSTPAEPVVDPIEPGWKIYRNEEHGFEVQYPPHYVTTGKEATNSTLGSADEKVAGVFIGPLVFVPVGSPALKADAESHLSIGELPEDYEPGSGGIPPIECTVKTIPNSSAKIRYIYCTGEGGPAHYAYIEGEDKNIFVDGYSCGWDTTCDVYGVYPGRYVKNEDVVKILSTFKFTK